MSHNQDNSVTPVKQELSGPPREAELRAEVEEFRDEVAKWKAKHLALSRTLADYVAKDVDTHLLREALASLEHNRWARWQGHLHSKCGRNQDGSLTIQSGHVMALERQIKTPYWDLSDPEKESDRKEADNTLAVLAEHGIEIRHG